MSEESFASRRPVPKLVVRVLGINSLLPYRFYGSRESRHILPVLLADAHLTDQANHLDLDPPGSAGVIWTDIGEGA